MANEKPVRFLNDVYFEDSFGGNTFSCAVGNNVFGFSAGAAKGAMHFLNVDIGQNPTLDMCELRYVYSNVGSSSGSWKHKCYGIDEDNTSDYGGGSPFGRPKTSAVITTDEGAPTSGGTKTFNVKDIVVEICSRGGWVRNNAIGFLIEDNGSSTDVYAVASNSLSYLVYRETAEPNFLPTPVTIAAPTFPELDQFGIKVSRRGVDVRTAIETDYLFTSQKEYLKIKAQAQVATTSGVNKVIPHGLGYKPVCYVFVRKNNLSFELPRLYGGAADPVGGGVQGYFYVDSTNLTIFTSLDADVYYYITLEEQPT